MRLSTLLTMAGTFSAAGLVSVVTAYFTAGVIENASKSAVLSEMDRSALRWTEVDTNGLQVFLIGTAPDEAARFKALAAAGRVVDAARVIDQMQVEEPEDLAPPHFSIEILRNDSGISVIGLLPASTDRAALIEGFSETVGDGEISDFLETANYPAPDGWEDALEFAASALDDLPRSKISIDARRVVIKAMTESDQVRRRLESHLSRRRPDEVELDLELSAPRPVITPFTLRFLIDDDGARFDACSADTEAASARILEAAVAAGLEGKSSCTLGLGVPSRRWADAVAMTIGKLKELGGGTLTFTNADISLVAHMGTDQALFDRIVGELESTLPAVFVLHADLPKPPETATDEGPPEFIAIRSPEGSIQVRGRIGSEISRQLADSFARARFRSADVKTTARVADNLPADWQVRALAGIEALSLLENGAVTVTPDNVAIKGKTGNQNLNAEIAQLMTSKLGDTASFEIDVAYDKRLDPTLNIPTPPRCVEMITEVIGARKISFEPSSANLDATTEGIMDDLAELLIKCGDIPLEIGGHTDSQGRETMNEALSRDRAQAVLDALLVRRVPVRSYKVVGYGESDPIADNGTEEGREANRRITFNLVAQDDPEQAPADGTDETSSEPPADGAAADAAADEAKEDGAETPAEGTSDG
jgi:OOP family OmpA-OmpF porin